MIYYLLVLQIVICPAILLKISWKILFCEHLLSLTIYMEVIIIIISNEQNT